MRNLLILLLLCLSVNLFGTTYYISPSGSDSNSGTSGSPWKTLAYACSRATTSGDIIHVNAGTYNESSQCQVPVGVSIEGAAGAVPVLNLSYQDAQGAGHDGALKLVSNRTATFANGNQSISYLDLRGTTGVTGITCEYRNNVTIHHLSMSNFGIYGISFYNAYGCADWWYPPTVFMTGHSIYNCTFTNLENWLGGSYGFLYHDNICDNSASTGKCLSSESMRRWKMYNNTFSKAFSLTGWNFIFETYRFSDECEIYNNTFSDCSYSLDISDVRNGAGTYGLKIHDNQFIRPSIGPINTEHGCYTLNVEGWGAVQGLQINNNYFKNVPSGISIGSTNQHYNIYPDGTHWAIDHDYIYYNVFENIGNTNAQSSVALWFWEEVASGYSLNQVYDNIWVCNNIFSTTTNSYALPDAFKSYWTRPVTNFHFDNNIIQNFTWIPEYFIYSSNFSGVSIQKNLHYNNGSNSITYATGTPSGTINNLTPANPLFTSAIDFHLLSGSPAINSGIALSLPSGCVDYEHKTVGNPPEVGAYESGSSPTPPTSPLYQSAVVQNTTPSLLEMTYDLTLSTSSVPAASAFTVLVNSAARTVNTVAIVGTKVQLTLSSPVVFGNTVTVSYTKPATNPLQTAATGQAATISAQTVTNNVSAVNPVYVSSAVADATPALLEMTYNLSLANVLPSASSFSVLVNSTARTVNTVAISGTKVQLTLSGPVVYGDVVTVSYTKPATNPLQTTSGGQAVTISAQTVTNNVGAVNPVYVSSSIANATPTLLEMTYNLSLANVLPSASSFSVLVNSTARIVNSVGISGTKVQLTLSGPVVYGDVVTVSYTKPATNPLQTSTGAQAITIGAQTVTNNVLGINPVYVNSAVANATPSVIEMTYNLSLANLIPAASSFSVLVNSTARTVNSVVISGTKVQLTLSGPVLYGDIVTVSYTKPATNPLQTSTGAQAITIGAQAVTNNVLGINPGYVSSAVANATPSVLEMTYNLSLANIVPVTSAFTVMVNSANRTVNSVVISGVRVQLGLTSPIHYGDVVTVSYLKPAVNGLQTTAGGLAGTISNQSVTNNCVNILPTVTITSPSGSSTFADASNITINATASDADGSVRVVEFYNGSTKLGAATSAPYSFTWNSVPAGNYSITAIATDNFNATNASSAILVTVSGSSHYRNKHPYIKIYNPHKGNTYTNLTTITIDAVASDSDGMVKKVEFFNGSSKLVELTEAPYTYTWKDVLPGTYTITAIATDNVSDTTISSPIEFIVGTSSRYDPNSEIVKLYPNPNDGHFSIEFINPMESEKGDIIITDLGGKMVYSGPVLKEELKKQIDLSGSKSGVYVMMIKDKEILVTKKFIKK